jgi:hypothetical protein
MTPTNTYTASTGYVRSLFANDSKWNDIAPKNDYTTIQWLSNPREVAEFQRISQSYVTFETLYSCTYPTLCTQHSIPTEPRPYQGDCGLNQIITDVNCETSCQGYNPCTPVVAFFSPSEEVFKFNSINHGWTKGIYDSQYGGITWNAVVKQSMDDPLWVAPPMPCNHDGPWSEDDGTCTADYAGRPQFEARCEVPTGAPGIPAPSYIGCLKTTDFTSTTCPAGNVCSPPFFDINANFNVVDNIYPYTIPWITYSNKLSCVCADGTFSTDYGRNGIVCSDIVPPP